MTISMKIDLLFIKFILVGILNTLFGYFIFACLLFCGLHYAVAVVLGTIIAILFNFKTTGKIVFKNNDNKLIFRFITLYAMISIVNIGFLKIAKILDINLYIAAFFLTGFMAIISFLVNKNWVFKERNYEKN